LLDAAFLVPRAKASRFRKSAAREAKLLARQGYDLTLTGPWPPYTFVQG
jgi:gas vesicle protein GvpL/GvpF